IFSLLSCASGWAALCASINCASRSAQAMPAGPPPTMTTSAGICGRSTPSRGLRKISISGSQDWESHPGQEAFGRPSPKSASRLAQWRPGSGRPGPRGTKATPCQSSQSPASAALPSTVRRRVEPTRRGSPLGPCPSASAREPPTRSPGIAKVRCCPSTALLLRAFPAVSDQTYSRSKYAYPEAGSLAVSLNVFQINVRRNDIADNLGGSDHVSQELALAIGTRGNHLCHRAAMAGNAQRLSSLVDSLDQTEALGLKFGNGNIVHGHYFTDSHNNGQYPFSSPPSPSSLPQSAAGRCRTDCPRSRSRRSRKSELLNLYSPR